MSRIYRIWCAFTAFLCIGCSVHAADRALADAIEKQDFPLAKQLLESNPAPDSRQPDGTTALIWAAYHANSDLVQALLQHGADPAAANRYGVQAIHLACRNGDLNTARLLLENGANPGFTLPSGESALMTASRSGNPDVVRLLLEQGANVNHAIAGNQTALMWAAAEGNADVADLLLRAGADPSAKTANGFTPVHFAARGGYWKVIQPLLAHGVDINSPLDWTGNGGFRSPRKNSSPLILALENAHFELAVNLLEAGADPNDMRSGYAPLHTMTWVRKAHLGDSADPEPPIRGKMSSTEFLVELIGHGADVNKQLQHGSSAPGRVSEKGATPFFLAADREDLEMMKLLVRLGADPHIANADGVTPLMVAAGLGRGPENDEAGTQQEALAAVAYCIELGMDVNAVDANGETAMHGAAYGQWPDMVRLLHENGADIQIWNNLNAYDWSPLLIAQGYRRGNFKPSYDTIAAIERIMEQEGVTLRFDPPPEAAGY